MSCKEKRRDATTEQLPTDCVDWAMHSVWREWEWSGDERCGVVEREYEDERAGNAAIWEYAGNGNSRESGEWT